ncbi:MAG: heavy metal translocating P-type ATPase [Pseudomonadota bacterium]
MSCCAAAVTSSDQIRDYEYRREMLEQAELISSSVMLGEDRYKTDFVVPEMHCAGCIGTIERGLIKLDVVEEVRANLTMKTISVVWNSEKGKSAEITHELGRLGFSHHLANAFDEDVSTSATAKSLLLALAVAGFAAANIMLLSVSVWSGADVETAQLFHLISGMIAVPAVAFSGQPFFKSALKALLSKRLNMDVPISLAVILALGMSVYESLKGGEQAYFDASVTLLFFLLIGRYLDQLMRQKARGAVKRLHSISSKGGVLVNAEDDLSHIPLKDIQPDMRLRVFPGERFPVNGQVLTGNSDLDRSHVTGESLPFPVQAGDTIEAGTLNLTGPLDINTTTTAENSFLGEMTQMMAAAENSRSKYVRIADRVAKIYAPVVHLLALLAFLGWMFSTGGDWHTSIYVAIAVLIITCPCALGLAVPVAHVIGANRLMQNGILMRDGTALERLSNIDTVVFDKTGTLTADTSSVTHRAGAKVADLSVIKALASKSSHPVAKAVKKSLNALESAEVEDVVEHPGLGIEGTYNNRQVRFGRPEWVHEISRAQEDSNDDPTWSIAFAQKGSHSVMFATKDALREGAKEAVGSLDQKGLMLEVLSGDQDQRVFEVSNTLGIDHWFANQRPSDKVNHISNHDKAGNKVLMVGDGINDSPALSASHVSMVPATASDVGRHCADFVFTRPSLMAVPFAITVSMLSARIVRQNFGIAITYNCIAVPLAMAGYVTPLVAAIAMSVSSIAVVANSFRIQFTGQNLLNVNLNEAKVQRIKNPQEGFAG